VNVKNNPSLTKALQAYMENNNITKDTDVLEALLIEYSKTLELPKNEEPELNPRPSDDNNIDRSDLAKWVGSLKDEV
tara:strand:+ start:109 stop:339 length:231 start_codon:yes stop_codon:yes gene_type:complete